MSVEDFVELLRGIQAREERYYENPLAVAQVVKEVMEEGLGEVEVFLFGSVVRGEALPGKSDIDIIVVSERVPRRARDRSLLKTRVYERLGDPSVPLDIHIVNRETFEKWYLRFVREMLKV